MKNSWPIIGAFVAFALIVGLQVAFATDVTLTNDVIIGVDSPKTAIVKLEENDEELLGFINELKDASASSTAPTAPNVGELWFDTSSSTMKHWIASTWHSAWHYTATGGGFEWIGDIDSASIEADTLSAPYATITDLDVAGNVDALTAVLGSATVGTLTTSNWSQSSATFTTLDYTFHGTMVNNNTETISTAGVITWDLEFYDTISGWEGTTNPDRITVPAAAEYIIFSANIDLQTTTADDCVVSLDMEGYTSGDALTYRTPCKTFFTTATDYDRTIACTTGPINESDIAYFEIEINENCSSSSIQISDSADNENKAWLQVLTYD